MEKIAIIRSLMIGIVCVLAAAIQPSKAFCDDPPKKTEAPKTETKAADDMVALLKSKGYVDIPLRRNKLGLLEVAVKVNGQPLDFIVDSGAGSVVIDSDAADRLKLPRQKTNHLNAGIGGAIAMEITPDQQLVVGPCSGQYTLTVGSLSFVNAELKKVGDQACAGLLGFPFLKLNGAVIDYPSERLLLMGPTAWIASAFDCSKSPAHLEVSVNRRLDNYQLSFNIAVKLLDDKPEVVSYSKYGMLQSGMTYAEVAAALGGSLDKCKLAEGFTGSAKFLQSKNHINLTFKDGKVTGKSFEASE